MIDPNDFNPDINHHIKPFRGRKLGRAESFDLVMYKYIRLEYVLNMLDTGLLRFDNIKKWEDVYENFVEKEEINLINSKLSAMPLHVYYGQSWTTQEESDAMWRIYSNYGCAVRVKTIFPDIHHLVFEWNKNHEDNIIWLRADHVHYAEEEEINNWLLANSPMNHWAYSELLGESLFIKRCEFAHEKEVRVILSDDNKVEKDYLELDFEPNKVFHEIVIDPRMDNDEFIRQRNLLVAHGYEEKKIRKSTLYDFQKLKLDIDMSEPCDFLITVYEDGHPVQKPVYMEGPG